MIYTEPSNMILTDTSNSRGECLSGIGATNGYPYILGDTFMQQLVTIFDISDKMQMRIAKRV